MQPSTWRAVALSFALVAAISLICAIYLHTGTGGQVPFDYGIVIDAGSSHSDVILYKWLGDQVKNTAIVQQVSSCETHHGIDDAEEEVDDTLAEILPCLKKVTGDIDFDTEGKTITYLGATAGMRLLAAQKAVVANLIYSRIENELHKYKDDNKQLKVGHVRELTGAEEGFYAWVTANFVTDNFPVRAGNDESDKTVGILDMGGASVQIAYETADDAVANERTTLYGKQYKVRSSSSLCFGSDELVKRHLAILIMEVGKDGRTEIGDPCLNKGASRTVSGSEISQWLCTETVDGNEFYDPAKTYNFVGQYNSQACNRLASQVYDADTCQKTFKRCMIEEPQQPPANMTYYAMSSFYYATRVLSMDDQISFDDFLKETDAFCSQSWDSVVASKLHDVKFAIKFCFQLKSMRYMLSQSFKFSNDQWKDMRFAKKLGGHSIGWSLGLMINSTTAMSPLPAEPPVLVSEGLVSIVIVAMILFALAVLFFFKSKSS
ncbi:Ectonucleoside triphosphate diphosphohydrolase 3 [Halotydeus destructor]|nr:Ectonucleoside triphosphate diphosphohydrolase 3 [Halotydeus destructor]